MMDTSPNCWGMVSSSTLAIPTPMKMMPNELYELGLGILAAMEDLNTRLQQDKGIQLALRVGIHTGLVVVGDMGGAGQARTVGLGGNPEHCCQDPRTGCAQYDRYQ